MCILASVGNEVCPNTEREKINSGTTGTENTHMGTNDTCLLYTSDAADE